MFASLTYAEPKPLADIPVEAGKGLEGRFWKGMNGQLARLTLG
jgi:hypothetical protein